MKYISFKVINLNFSVNTKSKSLNDITYEVSNYVENSKIINGLCTLFIKHTSASLVIQENADPNVLKDIIDFFDRVVPESENYAHKEEGPDDMPAHIKSALTNTSINIPIKEKKLDLGTWQGVFIFEHRYKNNDPGIRRIISMTIVA